jgi:hypothetical protein
MRFYDVGARKVDRPDLETLSPSPRVQAIALSFDLLAQNPSLITPPAYHLLDAAISGKPSQFATCDIGSAPFVRVDLTNLFGRLGFLVIVLFLTTFAVSICKVSKGDRREQNARPCLVCQEN